MDWFKCYTDKNPEVLNSNLSIVGAWHLLLCYCARHENGGILKRASTWESHAWLKNVGLRKTVVTRPSLLWHWDGEDLHVHFYDKGTQDFLESSRRYGAIGGAAKKAKGRDPSRDPGTVPRKDPTGDPGSPTPTIRSDQTREEKREEDTRGLDFEPVVAELEEVRTWASMVGVDPEYAVLKWRETHENHGWIKNGRLIDWRAKWKRYWEEDRQRWFSKKKNAADGDLAATRRKPGDEDWWWNGTIEELDGALTGALLSRDPLAERMREVWQIRKRMKT